MFHITIIIPYGKASGSQKPAIHKMIPFKCMPVSGLKADAALEGEAGLAGENVIKIDAGERSIKGG